MDQWVILDRTKVSLLHQRCRSSSSNSTHLNHHSSISNSISSINSHTSSSLLNSRILEFQHLAHLHLLPEDLTSQSACTQQLSPTLSRKPHPQHSTTDSMEDFSLPLFLEFLLLKALAETRCLQVVNSKDPSSLFLERSQVPTLASPCLPTSRDFSLL